MKKYRYTWRHEIEFEAEDDKEARNIVSSFSLSVQDDRVLCDSFVDDVSFECVSDDYREVSHG